MEQFIFYKLNGLLTIGEFAKKPTVKDTRALEGGWTSYVAGKGVALKQHETWYIQFWGE